MSINVGYFVKESVQNFRRNWVMSLGAVITIFLSLLLVGIFLATGFMVNSVVKSVEDKVTIQVFLKDGAATADVNALQQQLLSDALVKGVDYTSKEEALEKFKKDMAQSPEIIEQLETNPLPASLDVTLKDPRTVQQMVNNIKK
ncbi:MAG: ABC transporter permease, partial [Actinobacteria bacterium]